MSTASGLASAPSAARPDASIDLRPARALARRAFRDARVRTFTFAYLFAAYAYIQPIGYRHAYPTLADRLGFAHSFANNTAIRLFYGEPDNILTVGGYTTGGSVYLALATATVMPVFVGVGAVASQLAPTRRIALELGGAVVSLFFLLRVIADTASGTGWLRWATPLGWAEELRPFAGPRPIVLVLPILASALLLTAAARIAAHRDIGTGVLPARDTSDPRLPLLSSSTAQALRSELGSLIVWLLSVGGFAFILGVIANSISAAGVPKSAEKLIAKLGAGSILMPSGYIAFVFIFFVLAVSLFSCAQIGAARNEEAEQRLETLLALPVGRRSWLGGRLVLAAAAVTLALAAGVLTWAGASSGGAAISLPKMIEAGANCLPAALLFLGVATLAYATLPRASAGIAYGLVTVSFLWDLVGSLLGVPRWLVDLTPFKHVAPVPVQPFQAGAAAVMVVIGAVTALVALELFRRRDLLGN